MADPYALLAPEREPSANRGDRPLQARLRATFGADKDAVAGARHMLVGWLETQPAADWATDDIALAVTEACTNVVYHAYPAEETGPIELSAAIDDGLLSVTVADTGVGMRPRIDSPGGGLGLTLMSTLAATLRVDATDAGTTVLMTFLPQPPG
jgi:serine/threonine-protein kinase RsbW